MPNKIMLLFTIVLTFGQLGCAGMLSVKQRPVPVIFDTDIGYDIDDTWALAFILASPELDLKLVVTDYQNTPEKAKIVAKFLEAAGRIDVAVGIGKKCNDIIGPQRRWIPDYKLSQYPGKIYQDGIQAMIDTIMNSPQPMILLATGPVPNLPEALKREPRIVKKARLIGMGGSIKKQHAEWNIRAHRPAAQKAYAADWDITLAPLDTANLVVLDGQDYAKVRDADNPMA
ncbi:MAG: nucleoside hydrolase, partial [Planctomycetota bacterium]